MNSKVLRTPMIDIDPVDQCGELYGNLRLNIQGGSIYLDWELDKDLPKKYSGFELVDALGCL